MKVSHDKWPISGDSEKNASNFQFLSFGKSALISSIYSLNKASDVVDVQRRRLLLFFVIVTITISGSSIKATFLVV